jgi:hypothetical protein
MAVTNLQNKNKNTKQMDVSTIRKNCRVIAAADELSALTHTHPKKK